MNDGTETQSSSKPKMKKKRKWPRIAILVISYALVALITWKIAEQWKMDPAKQQAMAEQEIKDLTKAVGKLMLIPSNEVPQIATIDDAETLAKTQTFFIDVKNGDKVLVYIKNQKAIVYRPSENRIVNVGPVVTDNSAPAATTTSAPKPTTSTQTTTRASSTPSGTSQSATSSSGAN